MKVYGLIGNPVAHSFSEKFFKEKFENEGINATYKTYKLADITEFQDLVVKEKNLSGLNVTIPYKEQIIPFLDQLDDEAEIIGAVNTIKFIDGKRIGYNTDCFGFMKSIFPILENQHENALILGTGGAAKAVAQALKSLGVSYKMVSRNPSKSQLGYDEITKEVIAENLLIVNCTPLGTYPKTDEMPPLPYDGLTPRHLLYDLTYNPVVTTFLAQGQLYGTKIYNGQKMLEYQAEKSYDIWNSN